MAFSRNHAFVSAIADGADATLVRPSNWNAGHSLSGAVSGGIPYFDSTTSEATSALLAANQPMLGGGAGAPPSTLANGNAGQFLKSNGTTLVPTWATPTVTVGDTATNFTAGSIPYIAAGPVWAQDNASFSYTPTLLNSGPGLQVGSGNGALSGATIGHASDVTTGAFAIHSTSVTRSAGNYAIAGHSSFTELNAPSGGTIYIGVNGAASQTITAAANVMNFAPQPASAGAVSLGIAAKGFSKLYLDYTDTATVGNVTINKASGTVNLGAGGTSLVLTNSFATAASKVYLNADGAPGNIVAVQLYGVPAAGNITINAIPAVTNQTAINFLIINSD